MMEYVSLGRKRGIQLSQTNFKIDNEEMSQRVTAIETAVEAYEGLGDSPFKEELGYLQAMNTDFTAKLEVMVDDLNDSNSKLTKTLLFIASASAKVLGIFEELDEGNASAVEGS